MVTKALCGNVLNDLRISAVTSPLYMPATHPGKIFVLFIALPGEPGGKGAVPTLDAFQPSSFH